MSGHQRNDLWQLYETRNFADLWYGARSAGERLRALTLERLYRNRPYPGGPHPDPREPAVFSSQAILSVAAFLVGLRIDPTDAGAISGPGSNDDSPDIDEETGQPLPYHGQYPKGAPLDAGVT